ncbi:hypothetical protein CVD19_13875 [Bacillus sp. T33-2]|nr:hypothetical protein CVD19_13875 [Bacillus sp. T33-2]
MFGGCLPAERAQPQILALKHWGNSMHKEKGMLKIIRRLATSLTSNLFIIRDKGASMPPRLLAPYRQGGTRSYVRYCWIYWI